TYTKAFVELNHQEILTDTADLYDGAFEDKILGIKTYYERQWLSRGLTIKYLHFVPKEPAGGFVEPEIEIEPDSYRSFSRSRRVQ
ncbi:MAG: tRNA (guanosine(46)-N7)-methyltransferase TrmB, partial [Porphyromonadaceae bacterium]|nr:tRNA (guanosine(46)-N7)-methyltransferase TrmB [Porphyromonadaceae bacterium]